MTKTFGKLRQVHVTNAFDTYRSFQRGRELNRLRETRVEHGVTWFSYFTLVFTGMVHFAPDATAATIVAVVTNIS
ncbi:MAG: hypothetical protein AAFP99_10625 [Pseudomonadota bacterium]